MARQKKNLRRKELLSWIYENAIKGECKFPDCENDLGLYFQNGTATGFACFKHLALAMKAAVRQYESQG